MESKRYLRKAISLSEPELAWLRVQAAAEGQSVSGLIRSRALRLGPPPPAFHMAPVPEEG